MDLLNLETQQLEKDISAEKARELLLSQKYKLPETASLTFIDPEDRTIQYTRTGEEAEGEIVTGGTLASEEDVYFGKLLEQKRAGTGSWEQAGDSLVNQFTLGLKNGLGRAQKRSFIKDLEAQGNATGAKMLQAEMDADDYVENEYLLPRFLGGAPGMVGSAVAAAPVFAATKLTQGIGFLASKAGLTKPQTAVAMLVGRSGVEGGVLAPVAGAGETLTVLEEEGTGAALEKISKEIGVGIGFGVGSAGLFGGKKAFLKGQQDETLAKVSAEFQRTKAAAEAAMEETAILNSHKEAREALVTKIDALKIKQEALRTGGAAAELASGSNVAKLQEQISAYESSLANIEARRAESAGRLTQILGPGEGAEKRAFESVLEEANINKAKLDKTLESKFLAKVKEGGSAAQDDIEAEVVSAIEDLNLRSIPEDADKLNTVSTAKKDTGRLINAVYENLEAKGVGTKLSINQAGARYGEEVVDAVLFNSANESSITDVAARQILKSGISARAAKKVDRFLLRNKTPTTVGELTDALTTLRGKAKAREHLRNSFGENQLAWTDWKKLTTELQASGDPALRQAGYRSRQDILQTMEGSSRSKIASVDPIGEEGSRLANDAARLKQLNSKYAVLDAIESNYADFASRRTSQAELVREMGEKGAKEYAKIVAAVEKDVAGAKTVRSKIDVAKSRLEEVKNREAGKLARGEMRDGFSRQLSVLQAELKALSKFEARYTDGGASVKRELAVFQSELDKATASPAGLLSVEGRETTLRLKAHVDRLKAELSDIQSLPRHTVEYVQKKAEREVFERIKRSIRELAEKGKGMNTAESEALSQMVGGFGSFGLGVLTGSKIISGGGIVKMGKGVISGVKNATPKAIDGLVKITGWIDDAIEGKAMVGKGNEARVSQADFYAQIGARSADDVLSLFSDPEAIPQDGSDESMISAARVSEEASKPIASGVSKESQAEKIRTMVDTRAFIEKVRTRSLTLEDLRAYRSIKPQTYRLLEQRLLASKKKDTVESLKFEAKVAGKPHPFGTVNTMGLQAHFQSSPTQGPGGSNPRSFSDKNIQQQAAPFSSLMDAK